MFKALTLLLTYNLCLLTFAHPQNTNALKPQENVNDTVIELFNSCKCVMYYLCDENNYVIKDGRGLVDIRTKKDESRNNIVCSNPAYYCCKEQSEDGEITTPITNTTTTNPIDTNGSTIELKNPIVTVTLKPKRRCGNSRPIFDVRALTPQDHSVPIVTGEIPWFVSIFKKNAQGKHTFKCAGSLIHPQVILTATHCIISSAASSIKILANGKETYQEIGVSSNDERSVTEIIKHPDYYSGGLYNDISLIVLEQPYNLTVSPALNSVCLSEDNEILSEGKRCIAVGWGERGNIKKTVLKKVDLPIVQFENCQENLRKTRLGSEFILDKSFLCAGGEQGKDTCTGDGGGPLICVGDDYHFVQVGIVSWGVGCGDAHVPGLYTNVAKFRGWIDDHLKKISQ